MHYKSKTTVQELPHGIQSRGISLSKSLSPSYYTAIARAAFKAKKLQKTLVSQTCLKLEKECTKLVNRKKSVLCSTSLKDLKEYS